MCCHPFPSRPNSVYLDDAGGAGGYGNVKDGIPGGCAPGGASAAGRRDRGCGSGKAGSIAEKAEGQAA